MKIKNAELETVIGVKSVVPQHELPEFAFAGKSNVGKSSLINAMMNRKSLARTSSTPGKTQTINYYRVETDLNEYYLVDLPGYGYTKASPESRISWGKMVERYLKASKSLKEIFLLIDIRHKPGENDIQMYDWIISKGYRPLIIATKLDKLKKNEIPKAIKQISDTLGINKDDILIPFSSETKQGREDIQEIINSFFEEAANG
ncbi:MAG: ribosome biogenesis GTP-binding protein YihA/YsxC [Eubacteriales bacterium]|nr:ribosome biogenesis GTP-binding protein YihA/YsxC [Eubacteriales bacterium]